MDARDQFDSPEEAEFGAWCDEALELGILTEAEHHPQTFNLSGRVTVPVQRRMKTKTKTVERFLLHPHSYTPDFRLVFSERWAELAGKIPGLPDPVPAENGNVFVDVKPAFSRFHDAKQFSINQKWIYDRYAVYINKVVPQEWFAAAWVPEKALLSPKKGKVRARYAKMRTRNKVKEILDGKA